MKSTASQSARILSTAAVIIATSMFAVENGWAQQKQKISFSVPAANSRYTQQHVIDVGDTPGHQVRIYEIQRTLPADGPKIEGVRFTEIWTRALSDYTDLSGPGIVYGIYVLENGDKIFTRGDLVSQTKTSADGSRKTTSALVGRITAGTGKFSGIQGTTKTVTNADIKAGLNSNETEMEYWMGK